ncbi:hypothetical protein NSTCB13_05515 [Nostoc sp. DSM 114160]|jgi:hypothetical protein
MQYTLTSLSLLPLPSPLLLGEGKGAAFIIGEALNVTPLPL